MPDLDAQFAQSELERRLADVERKLNEYEEGGLDRFRQFGYLQLGSDLPRIDKYGLQVLTRGASRSALFFFDDQFQPDPNTPTQPSTTPLSALIGIVDRDFAQPYSSIGLTGHAGTAVSEFMAGAEDDTNDNAYTQSFVNVGSDIATVRHDMDEGRTFAQLTLNNTVLELASFTADPATLNDGDMWYRSDTDVIRARVNGVTVSLGAGGVATDAIWDAKGDLAVSNGADTAQRLAVGGDGKSLRADSGQTVGMLWTWGTTQAKNVDYTLDEADDNVVLYGSTARTLTLHTAGGFGGKVVRVSNSIGTAAMTIATTSSQSLDSGTSMILAPGASAVLVCDGSGWYSVSYSLPPYWMHLTADYTLTSTTSAQKLFNGTANGALTLPPGVYEFEAFLYLTTMSATTGNGRFTFGGTATIDRVGYQVVGIDNSSPLNAGTATRSSSVTAGSAASMVTAGTGTGLTATVRGMFRVSAGGTVIPQIALVTAAAAVVKAGSSIRVRRLGESSQTYNGAWS